MSRAQELRGRFSPDGRFVAFLSNAGGRGDVYVVDLESGRQEVASAGATDEALWSPDGRWLAYRSPGSGVFAVDVITSPELRLGAPRELFALERGQEILDFHPSGERLLAISFNSDPDETARGIRVVLNVLGPRRRVTGVGPGEAEVQHLGRAVRREPDVRGLQVPVLDAALVSPAPARPSAGAGPWRSHPRSPASSPAGAPKRYPLLPVAGGPAGRIWLHEGPT